VPEDGAHVENGLKTKAKRGKGKKAKGKSKMGFLSPGICVYIRFCG
jgi:hypothetical protein